MVGDIPKPELLPGGMKKGPLSDMATYHSLYKAAENVITQCLVRRGEVGWQAAGMNKII